jgi:endonuclease YncB( thermonuclease family)
LRGDGIQDAFNKIFGGLMAATTAIIFATVLRVVDGDTLSVDVNQCDIAVLCKKIEVRLDGIDSPEIRGKCPKEKAMAQQAKRMVEAEYPPGSTVVLSNPARDKYFRILANQPVVSRKLLDAGLARPYFGDKKKPWCD